MVYLVCENCKSQLSALTLGDVAAVPFQMNQNDLEPFMDSWYIAQRLIIINAEIVPNIPLDIFGRDIAYVVKYQSQRGRPIFNIILIENHEMHLTTRPILLALYLGYGRITLFGISTKATTTDRFVLFCHIMDISSSLTVHKYNENRVRGNRTPLHERICTSMQLARIDEKKNTNERKQKKAIKWTGRPWKSSDNMNRRWIIRVVDFVCMCAC